MLFEGFWQAQQAHAKCGSVYPQARGKCAIFPRDPWNFFWRRRFSCHPAVGRVVSVIAFHFGRILLELSSLLLLLLLSRPASSLLWSLCLPSDGICHHRYFLLRWLLAVRQMSIWRSFGSFRRHFGETFRSSREVSTHTGTAEQPPYSTPSSSPSPLSNREQRVREGLVVVEFVLMQLTPVFLTLPFTGSTCDHMTAWRASNWHGSDT